MNVQARFMMQQPSVTITQIWSHSMHMNPQAFENLFIESASAPLTVYTIGINLWRATARMSKKQAT